MGGIITMKYSIDDVQYEARMNGADTITIDGHDMSIKVIHASHDRAEFMLDNTYHTITYVQESAGKAEMEVDGVPITVTRDTGLDEIVYKNSGGSGAASSDSALLSQIPGKVVSMAVEAGDTVTAGDTVCVLESMKMQVSVKAHIDGTIKSLRIKMGVSIAKGDLIAEIE